MTHDEMVNLLRGGVAHGGGLWADLGAGGGNFTRALRDLTGNEAIIHAIDQDANALRGNSAADHVHVADFTRLQTIPDLPEAFDGILMTNALHWTRHQSEVMRAIYNNLRAGGHFILVEYAVSTPRPFVVPYPVPFTRFESLAHDTGFTSVRQIATRTSPRSNSTMYAALAVK